MIFYMPMAYMEESGVLAFFSMRDKDDEWSIDKDKELGEKYKHLVEQDLGSKVEQEYTPSQFNQAYGYRLPWTLLAAVDRVLGDPTNNDKVNRNPQPEKHYEAVRTNFSWITKTVVVKERIKDPDGGYYWETSYHPVKLLDTVDSYNSIHRISYRKEVSSGANLVVEKYVVDSIEIEHLPDDKNRLLRLLNTYKLPDSDIELIQDLAYAYSENPQVDETHYLLSKIGKNTSLPPIYSEWTGDLPLAGKVNVDFRITSLFGSRTDPFTGVVAYHDGVDLAAPEGTPDRKSVV